MALNARIPALARPYPTFDADQRKFAVQEALAAEMARGGSRQYDRLMRFMGLDLNLLVALDALLDERSVTAAALRLNLSQPAMSAALARLRRALGDKLLVVSGRRMVLTAHAERIAPLVAALLAEVEALVLTSTRFVPETSTRRFRVSASDYITAVLITPLLARLAEIAPGIRIDIFAPNESPARGLERGDYDLLFIPEQYRSPDHPHEALFSEDYVVAGWQENPAFAQPLTEAVFLAHGHIVVEFGQSRAPAFAETALLALGYRRRVEVVAPSFSAVPPMLPDTMRLAVMHARLAAIWATRLPLTVCSLPFDFPAMRETMQYHRTRAADGGLRWLMQQVAEIAKVAS